MEKKSKQDDSKKCADVLAVLDYLRKSRCMSGSQGNYGKVHTVPNVKKVGIMVFSSQP